MLLMTVLLSDALKIAEAFADANGTRPQPQS